MGNSSEPAKWPQERNFEYLRNFVMLHCYGLTFIKFDPKNRTMTLDCTICRDGVKPCYETFKN